MFGGIIDCTVTVEIVKKAPLDRIRGVHFPERKYTFKKLVLISGLQVYAFVLSHKKGGN